MNSAEKYIESFNLKDGENTYHKYLFMIEQIKLLADWNENHIEDDPEQVRKNIETIAAVIYP